MDSAKRKALAAAGWKVGDAADFLEMNDAERQVLDARVTLALAVRRQRQSRHLSQKALGLKLGTSQPRVAKIECCSRRVARPAHAGFCRSRRQARRQDGTGEIEQG